MIQLEYEVVHLILKMKFLPEEAPCDDGRNAKLNNSYVVIHGSLNTTIFVLNNSDQNKIITRKNYYNLDTPRHISVNKLKNEGT